MKIVDIGLDGDAVVAIAADGISYRKSEDGWEQLPGFANVGGVARRPIAASHHGPGDALVVLVEDVELGGSTALFRLDGDNWVSLGGPPACADERRARRIVGVTCFGDSLACCCDDGSLFSLEADGWTAIPGPPRK